MNENKKYWLGDDPVAKNKRHWQVTVCPNWAEIHEGTALVARLPLSYAPGLMSRLLELALRLEGHLTGKLASDLKDILDDTEASGVFAGLGR